MEVVNTRAKLLGALARTCCTGMACDVLGVPQAAFATGSTSMLHSWLGSSRAWCTQPNAFFESILASCGFVLLLLD